MPNIEHPTLNEKDLPAEGLDPTRPCGHWILSPARLPIPPRRRFGKEGAKEYKLRSEAQLANASGVKCCWSTRAAASCAADQKFRATQSHRAVKMSILADSRSAFVTAAPQRAAESRARMLPLRFSPSQAAAPGVIGRAHD